MLGAGASYSASADLAAIGDVLTKRGYILVINICDFVTAEAAWLLLNLLERCRRDLWLLLERSVGTCSHYGAPFRGPAEAEWLVI